MKVQILADCLNAKREFLKAGSTEEVDAKKDKKLFDLGLVEEYDAKKHGASKSKDSKDAAKLKKATDDIVELEEQVKTLTEAKAGLESQVETLTKDLDEATKK